MVHRKQVLYNPISSKCIYICLESNTTSQFKNDLRPPENEPVKIYLEK